MENEIKVVKRINLDQRYEDKDGKEHCSVNYYLDINGQYVAIRPCFSKGYVQLDMVANVVKNGSKK